MGALPDAEQIKREKEVAEEILSNLIFVKTGAKIEPQQLRKFLGAHWHRVSTLAHYIHDKETDHE